MPSCMCFVDHLVIMDDLIFHILQPLTKNASCMWRCTIKQVFVWKIHISALVSSKTFFSIQTLFSLNTKWFYFFGTLMKKFYIGCLSQNYFGSHYTCGEARKKISGQKVNVKYFKVDPYTLNNRIPRVFQNWISGQKINVKYFKVDPYTLESHGFFRIEVTST